MAGDALEVATDKAGDLKDMAMDIITWVAPFVEKIVQRELLIKTLRFLIKKIFILLVLQFFLVEALQTPHFLQPC